MSTEWRDGTPFLCNELLIRKHARLECDACGWSGDAWRAREIGGCSLTAGDPVPAGRCPRCEALVYPATLTLKIRKAKPL